MLTRGTSARSQSLRAWARGNIRQQRSFSDEGDDVMSDNDDDDTATSNGGRAGGILFSPRRNESAASLTSIKSSNRLERWPNPGGGLLSASSGEKGPGAWYGPGDGGGAESQRTQTSHAWSPVCTPRNANASEPGAGDAGPGPGEPRWCKSCKVQLPESHSPNLSGVCRECLSTGLFSLDGADGVAGAEGARGGQERPRRLSWKEDSGDPLGRKVSKEGQPTATKGFEPVLDQAPRGGGLGINAAKHGEPNSNTVAKLRRSGFNGGGERVPGPLSARLAEPPAIIGSSEAIMGHQGQSSIRYSDRGDRARRGNHSLALRH